MGSIGKCSFRLYNFVLQLIFCRNLGIWLVSISQASVSSKQYSWFFPCWEGSLNQILWKFGVSFHWENVLCSFSTESIHLFYGLFLLAPLLWKISWKLGISNKMVKSLLNYKRSELRKLEKSTRFSKQYFFHLFTIFCLSWSRTCTLHGKGQGVPRLPPLFPYIPEKAHSRW